MTTQEISSLKQSIFNGGGNLVLPPADAHKFSEDFCGRKVSKAVTSEMSEKYAKAILERKMQEGTPKAQVTKQIAAAPSELSVSDFEMDEVVLPDVPTDLANDYDRAAKASIEDEIEQRLLRLKCFNKTWLSNGSNLNAPLKAATSVTEALNQPYEDNLKSANSVDLANVIEPTESTREERDEFNAWYYEKIGESKPNRSKAAQSKPTPSKTS